MPRRGDVGGLHQPHARDGMAAGDQPLETRPVQGCHAEALEQAAVQLEVAGGRRAVGAEVVVGLLLAAFQVVPQVAADGGDHRRAELPGREHAAPHSLSHSPPSHAANAEALTATSQPDEPTTTSATRTEPEPKTVNGRRGTLLGSAKAADGSA